MIDSHTSIAEKFLKKGFWLYLFSFIIAPLGYIIKIIVSGELSVEEVGILYGIISLITLIGSFNDFGMTESIKRYIPEYVTNGDYSKVKSILIFSFIIQLVTSFIIFLVFYFGSAYIGNNYFKDSSAIGVLKIFSIFFIGLNIFQLISNFFLAIQNTFFSKIVDFIRMLAILGYTLGIFFLDIGSLINYAYAWLFGVIIGTLFAAIIFYNSYYRKYLQGIKICYEKKVYKEVFKYALLILLGAQAGTILGQIDMQMIIYILGNRDAGYYTNYLSIISIPIIIIGPVFAFLFPVLSEMYAKGEIEKIKVVKIMLSKIFLGLGIALNILLFIFGPAIAYTLFGEKFIISGFIVRYSILLFIFNLLLQINFNILAAIGKVKERVKIILIAIVINFITTLILIEYLGVYGASLATGLGWVSIWIMSERTLGKEFKTQIDILYICKNTILMAIIGVILYIISLPFLEISRGLSFIIILLLGFVYFGFFLIINKRDLNMFIGEIKKLKR